MIGSKKLWTGVGISAALLALFFFTVNFRRMFDALADANYVYTAPAIAMYLVSVLFRTIRWRALLKHMRPIPVSRLFPVVVVGYMANNLLPVRMGELVRSYYVGQRESVSAPSALATIIVERVLDALTLLFFVAFIALFVPVVGLAEAFGDKYGFPWPLLVVALSIPFLGLFGTLLLLALFPARGVRMAMVLLGPLPHRLRSTLRHMIDLFLEGLVPLRSPKGLAALFLMSVPIWLFEAGLFTLIGFSFGLDRAFDNLGEMIVAMVLVTAIANIGSSVPAAPGGIGLFELVARETLILLPLAVIDRSVAGAYVAVVHAALLLPMIVLGQVFLWSEHLTLRGLSRAGRRISEQGRKSMGPSGLPVTRGDTE